MLRKTPRRGWDEGSTAVETAIVIAVLCTLIFGILEFGMALWQWNTMLLAVQQAGRYAMINNATITTTTAEQQIWNYITGTTSGTPSVCTLTKGSINPPKAGNFCVYASTAAGASPAPSTMTLTAVYAYDVLGLTGTFPVGSQGTVPLD
jgi:Flp pilus assembly protein TadG